MTVRSEAPFSRHGGQLATDEPLTIAYTLNFGQHETPYSISHTTTGEWRNWRAILEENAVENPFDLGAVGDGTYPTRTEMLVPKLMIEASRS